MTSGIGNFIKSVFPSTVDRNGEVFKALLADGSGGGAIEKIFEDLEETRAAWQDAPGAYSLLEEQNKKLFGLISLLSQTDVSSDSVYIARNKMLFDGNRASRSPWGNAHDIKALFAEFFSLDKAYLINNCAAMAESLLADGDFESGLASWSLEGAEFYEDETFSGAISARLEKGGTLRQAVSIAEPGAYFLNFFLKGCARVRAKNGEGLCWRAIENGTGEWQAADSCREFEREEWDNCQCFFVLESADTVTIEIEAVAADTLVDFVRLHLKTGASMFTVLAPFEGGAASEETASCAPARDDFTENEAARAGTAVAGHHMAMQLKPINYDVMSYMEDSYIFGASGARAQEVANAFLELVKPAGIAGYVEILTSKAKAGEDDA